MGKAKKIKAVKRRKTGKDGKVKALWITGGVLAVICLIYVAISVYFMSHFFVNTKINGKNFSGKTASDVEKYLQTNIKDYKLTILENAISVYFMSHFFVNTKINGKNFSGKTASDVEKYLQTNIKDYKLTILENEGRQDVISGSEIGLEYRAGTETEKLLKDQNGFAWPKAFFTENSRKVSVNVSYNEESLNQRISQLSCLQTEQTPAENAKPEFDGNQYVIKPEVYGNAVDKERLTEQVKVHITEFQPQLDMVETKCYAKPKYTEDSKEVQEACDAMNKYVNASITYPMNEPVVVDKALISQWLQVDGEMKVSLNTEAMKQWFTAFGDKYDTQGTTRTFTTPAGKSATVTGGTYGWSIDEDTELVNLQNSILNGEVVTREPAYYAGGTAAAHSGQDWGNTYAEVDMSAQHMWYQHFKRGSSHKGACILCGRYCRSTFRAGLGKYVCRSGYECTAYVVCSERAGGTGDGCCDRRADSIKDYTGRSIFSDVEAAGCNTGGRY